MSCIRIYTNLDQDDFEGDKNLIFIMKFDIEVQEFSLYKKITLNDFGENFAFA